MIHIYRRFEMKRMKHRLQALTALAFAVATLPGCLPLPQGSAAHVTPAPTLQHATMTMHNGNSFGVQVSVPHTLYGSCIVDSSLYVQGFEDGYVNQWNAELSRPAHNAGAWLQAPQSGPLSNTSTQGFDNSSCRASAQEQGYGDGQRQAHNDLLAHPPVP
jgi:hypothetical protein